MGSEVGEHGVMNSVFSVEPSEGNAERSVHKEAAEKNQCVNVTECLYGCRNVTCRKE